MIPTAIDLGTAQTARYSVEVTIGATRARIWQALTEEMGAWWPSEFYTLPTATMAFEPCVGGRMFEDTDDSCGRLWYSVLTIVPPDELELAGYLMPAFGGPGTTLVRILLAGEGGQVTVILEDALVGRLTEDGVAALQEGWQTLLAALKAHVEG